MKNRHSVLRAATALASAAFALGLASPPAHAHWCDDLWASSYNIVVRPDSDTSPKQVYVQNNMGYQLINFKLTATATSGAITLTAPTTLKVAGTLLPGEKGIWKIASGSPAKIEDITFAVAFGNTGQDKCYPTKGANAVMIAKNDGTLYPTAPPPGLDSPVNPGCTGDMSQGRSLQYEAVTDFENVSTGLDKLLQLYCSGRASWNSGSDAVSPSYCKDTSSTSCPTTKPTSGSGSKYDYMHLWSAGELAIRKASLGARAAVFRARLACGTNDADMGFAGYAAFVLGYLGADDSAKASLQKLVTAGGDLGTIAKAGLYVMGDTTQKADVQAGLKASSVFVQVACAAAVGIVDNDDASVTSVLIPAVQWNEPDTSDDGKGLYAAHMLELVAFERRGWVANGVGTGTVTFYGEAGGVAGTGGATGTGGTAGSGGATSSRDAGTDARSGTGGAVGSGGNNSDATGSNGGVTGTNGGAIGSNGGATGSNGGATGTNTINDNGGATGSNGGATGSNNGGATGSGTTTGPGDTSGDAGKGCSCSLGTCSRTTPGFYAPALWAIGWVVARRRRR